MKATDQTALVYKVGRDGLKINGVATARGTTTTAPNTWSRAVLGAHLANGDIYLVTPSNHPEMRKDLQGKNRGNTDATHIQPHDWNGVPALIPLDQA